MMNSRRNPPWSDLPQELLFAIANLLTSNPIDILTFRAICKSWNSSSPPSSPFNLSHMLPLTSPCPAYSFDMRFHEQSLLPIISATSILSLRLKEPLMNNMEQDTKCWLMFVDQLTPSKLMIRQPLTKCYYSMPLNFPSCVDVPNIHVDEIGRFYNLSFHPAINKPPSMWSEYVHKVVLSSDESSAVALFHTGQLGSSRLRMSPNWEASEWDPLYTMCYDNVDARIDDIVYHKGKVFSVDRVRRVYEVDFSSWAKKMIVSSATDSGTKRKRLVESNGVIYLVVRESVHKESARFRVFELDEDLDEWVQVTSIGDMVFFFGLDFSFSVSTQKLRGSFKNNCIVYIEYSFKDYNEGVDDDDVTLFSNLSYGDLRVGVWHIENPYHCDTIGSYPDYSNVLWPPPTWLWSIDMSKRIGNLEAALDDLLVDAPAEKLKAMTKELPPLKQAILVNNNANQQDSSEIWRVAHTVQVYLNEVKDFHKHLETIKSKNVVSKQESFNIHDQVGSSSRGTELQGSVNGILLHLEETTTKLHNLKSRRQQPCGDVAREDDVCDVSSL